MLYWVARSLGFKRSYSGVIVAAGNISGRKELTCVPADVVLTRLLSFSGPENEPSQKARNEGKCLQRLNFIRNAYLHDDRCRLGPNRHSTTNFRDSNFNLNQLIWMYSFGALSTHEALLKASGNALGDRKGSRPLLFMRCYLVITHQRIVPPQDQRNKSELVTTVPAWAGHYCSMAQSRPILCNPVDCSTPGFPVLHHLPAFAQIHVHSVGDAIQPSHPLPSPSPPAFSLSQHQGLFQ